MTGRWLRRYLPRPESRVRLVCFPHASGNATFYRPWAAALPESVELIAVQYPGRLDRIAEPCIEDMPSLVAEVCEALGPVLAGPVVLFGHSMGAAVAHEVTRRVERLYGGPAVRLIVSGRPPTLQPVAGGKHRESDEVLWNELRRLGGTTADIFDHPDLCATVLPSLRADYRLIETYRPTPGPALATGILALTGSADPEVTPARMAAWEECTTGGFELREFPGGHFYLTPERDAVLAQVRRAVTATAARR